jgi:hypothetical protein
LTPDAAPVRAIASKEYTHMINEGARMKAMATAKNRPTVKMMRA